MSRVAVVTDTTQYLPREVIERHGIHLVSLYVNWNGRTDREIDLPDYDAYYDFLRSAGELPSTSQPSRRATSSPSTSRWSSAATRSSRSTSRAAISGTVRRRRAGARRC